MTHFHTTEPPWFDSRVSGLKPGGRLRLSDGKLVSFNGKAWYLYDFREKEGEVYEPRLSLSARLEIARLKREADSEAANDPGLPDEDAMPHPRDWPVQARVWLYKAGLNNDDIHQMGAFWNPKMQRVVLPYETLIGGSMWTARGLPGANPKYLFPYGVARRGGALYKADVLNSDAKDRLGLVIVEDMLSARRIAKATDYDALAIMGTSMDWQAITYVSTRWPRIVTWLDPDVWGQNGASEIRRQFGRIDIPTRNVKTERDPKLYDDDAIREVLET